MRATTLIGPCIAAMLAVGAVAFPANPSVAFEKCSISDGAKAYRRCLAYARMAGTPSQRAYAKRKYKEERERCRYSRAAGEVICSTVTP
jgi:hypothetical protein